MKEVVINAAKVWGPETTLRDKLVDKIHLATLLTFIFIVFLDWSYWKTAPYSVHTLIVYGIIFSFIFLRFGTQQTDLKDLEGLFMRQQTHIPKAIAALLAGLNSLLLTFQLLRCHSQYPGFLKFPYLILSLIITLAGYLQLAYSAYVVFLYLRQPATFAHQEMQDEQPKQQQLSNRTQQDNAAALSQQQQESRLRSHLKEGKIINQQQQQNSFDQIEGDINLGMSGRETGIDKLSKRL